MNKREKYSNLLVGRLSEVHITPIQLTHVDGNGKKIKFKIKKQLWKQGTSDYSALKWYHMWGVPNKENCFHGAE